jgi:hypothetical protein
MSVKRSKSWVEVGSGEDGHYDWGSELAILDDLKLILLDLQYVDRELEGRKLSRYLSELRKHDPEVPKLDYIENAFDLIRYHSFVDIESEFFDPDMPVSSIWTKVYVKRSNIKKLVKLLELAKEKLEQYCEREKVSQLTEKKDQEYDLRKKQEEHAKEILRIEQKREDERQKKQEEDKWVKETCSKIEKELKENSSIVCINDFLIDGDNQKIFVLTVHTIYRPERSTREIRVTERLKKNYEVYLIEESPPVGNDWGHISYSSRHLLSERMGWRQRNTILFCDDVSELENAKMIRDKYIDGQV